MSASKEIRDSINRDWGAISRDFRAISTALIENECIEGKDLEEFISNVKEFKRAFNLAVFNTRLYWNAYKVREDQLTKDGEHCE